MTMKKTSKKSRTARRSKRSKSPTDLLTKPKKESLDPIEKIGLEREIRKYVKKSGGFRKGESEANIARAKKLLKRAGRKNPTCDLSIQVPGLDQPTVAGMHIS